MDDLLPRYSFFPWLRQGIASQIIEEDDLAKGDATILERASIDLKVKIKGDGIVRKSIDTSVKLIGPGDIIGLSQNAIVKTEPLHWITNFEPNYFPYIEFYDEDFPWRYTPAKATTNHQLRPWLFLVILKEDEFSRNPISMDSLPPSITVFDAEISNSVNGPFPDADEIWAWAHVHFNGDVDPNNTDGIVDAVNRLSTLLNQNPDLATSRIICPRKLEANTSYYGFLIPSFETGRLAGLGVESANISLTLAQTASWGEGTGSHELFQNEYPVYHEFFFKTGATGDFEYLVRQLIPREMDNRVGRRPMDIQDPGYLLAYTSGSDPLRGTLALEGALRIPDNEGEVYPWPDTGQTTQNEDSLSFRTRMQDLINLGEDMTLASFGASSSFYAGSTKLGDETVQDDPIVAPPLYGRWHALVNKVDVNNASWINELNIDPRNRTVAGIGTSVIQKHQDKFMDMAWEQVGEVIEANKKLRWAQLAKETSAAMFNKHIKPQPPEHFIPLTAKMHKRIKPGAETVYQTTQKSKLPLAAESRAFRKLRRINGPVLKRLDPTKTIALSNDTMISKLADQTLKAAQDKVAGNSINQTAQLSMNLDQAVVAALALDVTSYNFKFTPSGSFQSPTAGANNTAAVEFKDALQIFEDYFKPTNWPIPTNKPDLDVNAVANDVATAIQPDVTIAIRVYEQLQASHEVRPVEPDIIVPILAAPVFRQPMYEAIRDLSSDLLIPNLNLIPQNTISLLETNPKFIESFMVGLNHEMGRELLWREYPTDQRCTCFRQFWDATDYINTNNLSPQDLENHVADIDFIHTWSSSSVLGSHNARAAGSMPEEAKLVLVIRGDLLKKFPNAVIYAVEAEWYDDGSGIDTSVHRNMKTGTEIYPIFGAKIEPDITFLGFDLLAEDAIGDVQDENGDYPTNPKPGWFFVIKERPGEPRFGLDIQDGNTTPGTPATWNDLSWGHFPANIKHLNIDDAISPTDNTIPRGDGYSTAVQWGNNAANMAMILYQNPVLVAFHAHEMLRDIV